ncbi:MAG TPA: hypothetical protein VM616_09295 [Gammaproteobacteria bacterium]|nr:hypothetical protein [Gammaproteobacteria bacterium]
MKKQLAIALGISLATGAAMANEGDYGQKESLATGQQTAMSFESLDVNQDSLISEQEAIDSRVLDSEAFASADTNQDGYLSRTEFDASVGVGTDPGLGTESDIELEDDAS